MICNIFSPCKSREEPTGYPVIANMDVTIGKVRQSSLEF